MVERAFSSMKFELTSKDADAIVEQDSSQNHDYKFSCLVKTEWVEYCMSKLGERRTNPHALLLQHANNDAVQRGCLRTKGSMSS